MSAIFDWKRFWHPRGTEIQSFDGFLADPEDEFAKWCNPEVQPFEAIADTPCLILLGEQGIGKSTAVKQALEIVDDDACCLHVDVGEFQTDSLLDDSIFGSPILDEWREGTHLLYLYLDSLDEGAVTPDIAVAVLLRRLPDYPLERLRLRLVCRTSAWQADLEDRLRALWQDDDCVKAYELAPLRARDVEEAAKTCGLDQQALLREVHDKEAVPLATRPLTLKMLLDEYSKSQQLPSSLGQLMHDACLRLCEEEAPRRRRRAGLSGKERLAIASRVAAITILANRAGIWCGPSSGHKDDAYVTTDDLCGGNEPVGNDDEVRVDEAAIREVLSTGLFVSRGTEKMGWCHRGYAEHLAAKYLADHMTSDQIMSLIVHPNDPARKLVPQLYAVVAWLVGMRPELADPILRTDFSVLLQCDPAAVDDRARGSSVQGLLSLYERSELHTSYNPQYRKLCHPGIAAQIEPYIRDKTKSLNVRYAAVDIAEACRLESLQDDLIAVALGGSELYALRIRAASAVTRICSPESRARLKPLALGEAGDDPDDELKGCGLQALWPDTIDAKELFSLLTFPKRASLFGVYRLFCNYDLLQHLHSEDLPAALEWLQDQPWAREGHWVDKLAEGILLKAWDNLDRPEVLEALAHIIVAQLAGHGDVFVPDGKEQDRHGVARAVMTVGSQTDLDPASFCFFSKPLLTTQDVGWLLEELNSATLVDLQRFIADIIGYMADVYNQPEQLDAILTACQNHPILAEKFSWLLTPVKLDSPEAAEMQERHRQLTRARPRDAKPVLIPPPSERVAMRLEECQKGNLVAWCDLNRQLTLEPDSTHYGDVIESDLTTLPGWKNADDSTRTGIINTAEKYLLDRTPEPEKWLRTNLVVNYPLDYSGYRAWQLLWNEAPDIVSSFSDEIWSRWSAVIVAGYDLKESASGLQLLAVAYAKVRECVVEAILGLIDRDNTQHGHVAATRSLTEIWDDRIASSLLDKSKDVTLKPDSLRELLRCLLVHRYEASIEYAKRLAGFWNSADESVRDRAAVACQSLLAYAPDVGWDAAWSVVQRHDEFGTKVIEKVVDIWDWDRESHELFLSDQQLADLYIWAVHHYPYEEDPVIDGFVGTRARVAMWKGNALEQLKKRGASEQIERIATEFPDLDWLRRVLSESQLTARYNSWVPPTPKDILAMSRDKRYRMIRSGRELLDVIERSLQNLETKLHDETPAVYFLWDHVKMRKKLYKPKDENAFSDFVKIHLTDDLQERGVRFSREVEISRPLGATPGERTDILVSAFMRDRQGNRLNVITAIIETKGCWNKELRTAMRIQLVDRYLKHHSCQHGLYLVGWFDSDCWTTDDHRRKHIPKMTVDEAKKLFCDQAGELSRDGRDIRAYVMNAALR